MQLFSGRSKERRSGGGGSNCQAAAAATTRHRSGRCRALCCGSSWLSMSSSALCSSADADAAPEPHPHPRGLSKLAHGMVQARLQSMIDAATEAPGPDELVAERPCRGLPRVGSRQPGASSGRTGVRGAAGGGPADEHHAAILQAFHEV